MGIQINDSVRKSGHFALQRMNAVGSVVGELVTTGTEVGVILNCHTKCEPAHVKRIAEMARLNPDQPYDVCAWVGPSGDRQMIWSGRLYWRDAA